MNCQKFIEQLDDYLEGALAGAGHDAAAAHLHGCSDCQRRVARLQARRAALRSMPVPTPPPGFFERALRDASRSYQPNRRRWPQAVGLALAASLALWLGAGWLPSALRAPAETPAAISIALHEVRTVDLAFNAEHELHQATLTITLPDSVELQGFPGQRQVSWQTDLARGVNVLSLPLVAVANAGGTLLARVQHGEQSTELTVPVRVSLPARTGALPGMRADTDTRSVQHEEIRDAYI